MATFSVSDSVTASDSRYDELVYVTEAVTVSISGGISALTISVSDSTTTSESKTLAYRAEDVREDFSHDTFNWQYSKWNTYSTNTTVTIANGVMTATSTTTSGYAGFTFSSNVNLVNSQTTVQVISIGNQSLASWEMFPIQVYIDANNKLFWYINSGFVQTYKKVGGTQAQITTVAWDANAYRFLRLRETGGTVYFERSSDFVNWNIETSLADPFNLTSLNLEPSFGTWQNEASGTTGVIDNIGVTPSFFIDSTTTSESVNVTQAYQINVSDSTTTSETVTVREQNFVSVTDSSATSETVTVREQSFISVSDSTTTSENTLATDTEFPVVTDSTVTSETVTVRVGATVSVIDSTTASESTTMRVVSFVSVTDSTTTSESVATTQVLNVSVSDSSTTSEAPSVAVESITDLMDDFQFDELIDTYKWTNYGGAQVTNVAHQLNMTSTLGGGYYGIYSNSSFNLQGKRYFVQVPNAGNQSIASWEVYPVEIQDQFNSGPNQAWIRISTGNVYAQYKTGGSTTTITSVAYNSGTMQWFSIRESAGTIYYDYSADCSTWTNIASVASPFQTSAVVASTFIGTWQAESSTTTAVFDAINVAPGQLQFNWGGYTWNKRVKLGASQYNHQFDQSLVSGPDGSNYVTLSISNGTKNYPYGSEIFTDLKQFGYGTYVMTIGTEVDNLDQNVVMGGMFLFDYQASPDYKEIDVDEVRYFSGSPGQLLQSHVWNNSGTPTFITNSGNVSSASQQTFRLIWLPGSLQFDAFTGATTGGSSYQSNTQTTNLPTAGTERMHINLWVQNVSNPQLVAPMSVQLQSFSFTPAVVASDSITTAEATTVCEIDLVSVSDSTTTSEVVTLLETAFVSTSDSTATSESITVQISSSGTAVSVSDSTTTSETISLLVTSNVSVSDSTTTSESVSLLITSFVNVSDSTATSESTSLVDVDFISVADSSATSETVKELVSLNVNVSDSTTTSEAITPLVPQLFVSVSDSVTTTEAQLQILDQDGVAVLESVTTSETITVVALAAGISVSDSTATSEVITATVTLFVSVSDSSTTSEAITVLLPNLYASASDSSTTSESVSLLDIDNVSVADSSATSETVTVAALAAGISVSDSTTTSESVSITVVSLVSVSDSTATSESVTAVETSFISVVETIVTGEALTLQPVDFVSVTDSTTTSEAVTVLEPFLLINVADSSTVSDTPSINPGGGVFVNDSSVTSETVTLLVPLYFISVSDATTTSEAPNVCSVFNAMIGPGIQMIPGVKIVGP